MGPAGHVDSDAGRGPPTPSRPLIGVTTSEVRPTRLTHPRPHSDPARPEMALGMTYMRALEIAGAVPVVIPPLKLGGIDDLLDQLGGVCLSGGPDIDPQVYRGETHPELGPTWLDLDELELALARRADDRGVPLLGICRGAQTLNVARGGDLLQHLPDLNGAGPEHRQSEGGEALSHEIEIERGTRLAEIVGATRIEVNSFHHQAVRRLGTALRASAHSGDGVIEAIEDAAHPFLLAVQWHAEFLVERRPESAIFGAFVEAARRRESGER